MNGKSYVGLPLVYLHLTLAHCKGQGQDNAHFNDVYIGNGDKYGKNYYCHQIASHV